VTGLGEKGRHESNKYGLWQEFWGNSTEGGYLTRLNDSTTSHPGKSFSRAILEREKKKGEREVKKDKVGLGF